MGSLPPHRSTPPAQQPADPFTATVSLRQLLASLTREQRRNQELLTSLAFGLRSFTNLGRFLELVPLLTARLVEAEAALLVPLHADGRLWRQHIHGHPQGPVADVVHQLAQLPDESLLDQGDEEARSAFLDALVQRQLSSASLFATTVSARAHIRGRLYVVSSRSPIRWSEVHRRHVQLVADLTGVAIETDTLLEDQRQHERVDRQLTIGAEIQAQLLPDHCPVIAGIELAARCRPAFQVGGDYYDFIPTRPQALGKRREQGRWAIVMGDVMGKGVPAGLLMTLMRGMLRAEVLSGHPPDRILHDLNQLAQEDLAHSHRFVTLFYSDYDPLTRRLRYANAAHNPPLLWRESRRRLDRLDSPGLLIGLQPEVDFGSDSLQLQPGDVILYYTDGVTEAPGLTGDRFDEPRLQAAFRSACQSGADAQGILDDLFARLDRYVGANRRLEDDASMVVLRVPGGVTLPSLAG
ncbi:serine/threonine protein phosphatase [Synechococcus sp. RSCCF101]|uniref:PP2C family protein-serine/threonine phosphatase n=1 Tax=Synechococcus sp. RSCCF101 TaxID=2511069 RepID=UPI001246AC94|nr:PP2C family protein-serine/threonine phosphatase [Synechococcus sp. RSCCF101]QEY32574.1 serine/threonine protein phosphatase [Synechococcus sp. RSCCF101]